MSNYVKTKLKTIYKKIIINLFNLIYIRPTKKIKNKDNSEKVHNLKIDKNQHRIFEFRNGRIYTDSNDTTAYISENNYISEASLQYKKFDSINSRNQKIFDNEVLKIGTPKFKKKPKQFI